MGINITEYVRDGPLAASFVSLDRAAKNPRDVMAKNDSFYSVRDGCGPGGQPNFSVMGFSH